MKFLFSKIQTKQQAHNNITLSNCVFAIYIILKYMAKIPHENYISGTIDFIIEVAIIFFLQKFHSRIAAFALFLVWPGLYIFWYWTELYKDPIRFFSALIFLYLGIRICQAAYKFHSKNILDQAEMEEST